MKRILSTAYWIVATILVTAIVVSFRYRIGEAFFFGALFLPGALFAKYAYSKIRKSSVKTRNIIFAAIGIILGEIFLFILAHYTITAMRQGLEDYYNWPDLPSLLGNPVFIAVIITVLSAGSVLFDSFLDRKFPARPSTITFVSERQSVTMPTDRILFVESNDAVTVVYTEDGATYKNKTPISQWESILPDDFVRIHRSYLVRRPAITSIGKETVSVGAHELPVSRKYRGAVRSLDQ